LVPLVQAELALDDDDPSAALGYADRYLRSLGGEQPIESAAAFELLVPARIRLGELDLAREAHTALVAIADAVGTEPVRAAERCAAARIAQADGDLDTARGAFEDAIEHYQRSAAPFEAAQTQLELAQTLASQDRADSGLELALAAAATFEQLGAERAAKSAGRLVGRLGGRSAAAKRSGLTRREVEILSLVAEGLSNRQIAERLVVSEHTVHRHLANLYAKLGVSSRAAAVALASQRDLLA
jgi:ATP/maltotriose-dependent transcriptional regulator MalT